MTSGPVCRMISRQMKLRYGLVVRTASYWNLYVAQQKGFFANERLEVEEVQTTSTLGGVEMLRRREVDIAANAPDMVIEADLAGAGLCFIGGLVNRQKSGLTARPACQSFADLKGGRVALGPTHSGTAILIEEMLRRRGLERGSYRPVDVGSTSIRLAEALQADEVDAVLLTQPYDFLLLERGYHRLAVVDDVVPDYPFACLAARRTPGPEERAAQVAFLRASAAAGAWLRDPANAAEATSILTEASGLEQRLAERTYALYFDTRPALAHGVELEPQGIEQVLTLLAASGRVPTPPPPAGQFTDTSLMQEALSQT